MFNPPYIAKKKTFEKCMERKEEELFIDQNWILPTRL
jgi:hypothetical protein